MGAKPMGRTKVLAGLTSREGDRLGHLVRGVQMLRSYGKEFEVGRYSKVINVAISADEAPSLCCLLSGESEATIPRWRAMVRETQWALGNSEGSGVLEVTLIRHGDQMAEFIPRSLQAILDHGLSQGSTMFLPAEEFARICDWGQQVSDIDASVIGEWPDATGL